MKSIGCPSISKDIIGNKVVRGEGTTRKNTIRSMLQFSGSSARNFEIKVISKIEISKAGDNTKHLTKQLDS